MPTPDPLADLRARFVTRSNERVAQLRSLVEAAVEEALRGRPNADTNEKNATLAEAVARLAHQLAGAAGTFGYASISCAAAALEDRVRAGRQTAQALDPRSLEPFVATLERRVAELGGPAF